MTDEPKTKWGPKSLTVEEIERVVSYWGEPDAGFAGGLDDIRLSQVAATLAAQAREIERLRANKAGHPDMCCGRCADLIENAERERDEARALYVETEERRCAALSQMEKAERKLDIIGYQNCCNPEHQLWLGPKGAECPACSTEKAIRSQDEAERELSALLSATRAKDDDPGDDWGNEYAAVVQFKRERDAATERIEKLEAEHAEWHKGKNATIRALTEVAAALYEAARGPKSGPRGGPPPLRCGFCHDDWLHSRYTTCPVHRAAVALDEHEYVGLRAAQVNRAALKGGE